MQTFSSTRRTRLANRRQGLKWGGWLLGIALLIVAARFLAPGVLITAARPALSLGNALSGATSGFFAAFENSQELAKQNAALVDENTALAAENRSLEEAYQDVEGLSGGAGATSSQIAAGVLARPPESTYDTLIVGAGRAEGVASGMEAFGPHGVPLGAVTAADAHAARVTLFSSPGVVTSAWVGSARVPVTLVGAGAGAFTASAPQAAGVLAGDAVFVGGPGALAIGSVVSVEGEGSDPVETLLIRSTANLFSVTQVMLRDTGAPTLIRATSTAALSAPAGRTTMP